ncbi:hypothetical protein PPROV_000023000 [Pycnococcus provasolii]|uniref:Calmodulin n=1 Tax=Pycnococcus provasolii TaxID=41880 RepID=A0A830H3A5_9CHLO|nr:hypothetical protein PPROV_000023000 [Pycnococcus provasolii]
MADAQQKGGAHRPGCHHQTHAHKHKHKHKHAVANVGLARETMSFADKPYTAPDGTHRKRLVYRDPSVREEPPAYWGVNRWGQPALRRSLQDANTSGKSRAGPSNQPFASAKQASAAVNALERKMTITLAALARFDDDERRIVTRALQRHMGRGPLNGLITLPHFVDAWSELGVEVPMDVGEAMFLKYGTDEHGYMPLDVFVQSLLAGANRRLSMSGTQRRPYQLGGPYEFDGRIVYRPCRKGVYPPSSWTDTGGTYGAGGFDQSSAVLGPRSDSLPRAGLSLHFIYGYAGKTNTAPNLYFTCEAHKVVYYTAAVGIVYDTREHTQTFYQEHNDDIKCLALESSKRRLVATGQVASKTEKGHRLPPYVNVWDVLTRKTLLKLPVASPDRATPYVMVCAVAFSVGGKLLAVCMKSGTGHTIMVFKLRAVDAPQHLGPQSAARDAARQAEERQLAGQRPLHDNWLDDAHNTLSVTLFPRGSAPARNDLVYKLVLSTAKAKGSGTDARVFVNFSMADGTNTGEMELSQTKDDFERGKKDVFQVRLPPKFKPTSELKAITIGHDNTGDSPGWLLDDVILSQVGTAATGPLKAGTLTWDVNKWLEHPQISITLMASDGVPSKRRRRKTKYSIEVVTSDIRGAGTDAEVYVTLHGVFDGNQVSGTKHFLSNAKENFDRDRRDEFYITELDCGQLSRLTVGHNSKGSSPGWHLKYVVVTNIRTNGDEAEGRGVGSNGVPPTDRFVFLCDKWLDSTEGDRKTERVLDVVSAEDMATMAVLYRITIQTSDKRGAGTDANVYCKLIGEKRSTDIIKLDNGGKNNFERGMTDCFNHECASVGKLKALVIGHDNHGLMAGWHCSYAEVTDEFSGDNYFFNCNKWLEKSSEAGVGTEYTLPVTDRNADAEQDTYVIRIKTGDRKGAGTDANVFIVLNGPKGSTKKTLLDSSANDFQRNELNTFELRDVTNVGNPVQSIRLGHDGFGFGSSCLAAAQRATPCNNLTAHALLRDAMANRRDNRSSQLIDQLRNQDSSISAHQARGLLSSLSTSRHSKDGGRRRSSLSGAEKAAGTVLDLTDPKVAVNDMTSEERAVILYFRTQSHGLVSCKEIRARYELFIDCDVDLSGGLDSDEVVAQMERLLFKSERLGGSGGGDSSDDDDDDLEEADFRSQAIEEAGARRHSFSGGRGKFIHGMQGLTTGQRRSVVESAIRRLGVKTLSFGHVLQLAYPKLNPTEAEGIQAFYVSSAQADEKRKKEEEENARRIESMNFAKELFIHVDGDGSGEIDINEFRELIMNLKNLDADEEQATQMFHEIDADGGGSIDLEEFQDWWVNNNMG